MGFSVLFLVVEYKKLVYVVSIQINGETVANSNKPFVGTSASVTAGTASTPTTSPFDNTHTVIVYNESSSNKLYVAYTDQTSIPEADAVVIPTNSTLTLPIGTISERCPFGDLKFDADGGTITARITYVNGLYS